MKNQKKGSNKKILDIEKNYIQNLFNYNIKMNIKNVKTFEETNKIAEELRKDFKIFQNREGLAYLDSGATAQRPEEVLNSVTNYYENNNANPHRGTYDLSIDSTRVYDEARETIAKFINAEKNEVVFTKNATESLNLIANSYGLENVKKGDKIVISIMEHHSNLVPWQKIAKIKEASLEYMYIDGNYEITDEEIKKKITEGTKIVSITQVSNVLGVKTPVEKIIKRAHKVGAVVIVDGSQSVPHMKVDVKKLDADFFVFSGHKLMSPMGIGVLYGKYDLLDKMPPFLMGGDMIEYVYEQETTFAKPPTKFEAGTQNIGGVIGLASAIKYLDKIGMKTVEEIEANLLKYAKEELAKLDFVDVYAPKTNENQIGVISFNLRGIHPHDTATVLNTVKVGVRAGDHCAQPLLRFINLDATCRASFYIYNTKADVDELILGLTKAHNMFEQWKKYTK